MAFFKYTALRLVLFFAVYVVCLYLRLGVWFSAAAGLIIALCIGYLFFGKLRAEAAQAVSRTFAGQNRPIRHKSELDDAAAEDKL